MRQTVQFAPVLVPSEIRLEAGFLISPDEPPVVARKVPQDVLDLFLEIKTPEDALRFASRFGLMNGVDERAEGCCRESVEDWFQTIKLLGAIRETAFYLRAGKLPPVPVRDALLSSKSRFATRMRKSEPRNLRDYLKVTIAEKVSTLLVFSQLRPLATWDRKLDTWVIQLGVMTFMGSITVSHSFLGLVVQTLFHEMTDTRGRALCSLCKKWYPPSRLPAEGRGNYCPTCRADGSMWRHLKQRQRAKHREQLPRG